MNYFNPQPEIIPRVLATDLDGTLIPLPNRDQNKQDLIELESARQTKKFGLIFATGRHFESVLEAIDQYHLPTPDWIVCDVGSGIYHRNGATFAPYQPYLDHLLQKTGGIERGKIEALLATQNGVELQPPDHQQKFKISYQCSAESVDGNVETIQQLIEKSALPFDSMGSVDPFLNCGLIDVLPAGVSKAYALLWLATQADFKPDEVIYAGDSGNDLAALVSGFRAIIVANASKGLSEKVHTQLTERQLESRLYLAKSEATSAVLEGCRHFGLI